jgi:hypothetical protein
LKILLDEDVPHPLARALSGHAVFTVAGMGWSVVKNGELLSRTEVEKFGVFVTGDKNLPSQQELAHRPFAVLVLSAIHWTVIRKNLDAIAQAIEVAQPGKITMVECGRFHPRRTGKRLDSAT